MGNPAELTEMLTWLWTVIVYILCADEFMSNYSVMYYNSYLLFFNRNASGAAQRCRFKPSLRSKTAGRAGELRHEDA